MWKGIYMGEGKRSLCPSFTNGEGPSSFASLGMGRGFTTVFGFRAPIVFSGSFALAALALETSFQHHGLLIEPL